MPAFSEYDKVTGHFTSQRRVCPTKPADTSSTSWFVGRYDPKAQRVNLAAAPLAVTTYAWSPAFSDNKAARLRSATAALADNHDSQRRCIRKIVIALATSAAVPSDALAQLQSIDTASDALVTKISAIAAAANQAALDAISD